MDTSKYVVEGCRGNRVQRHSLVVSTTTLHDMVVFAFHDMVTVPHDTPKLCPRHTSTTGLFLYSTTPPWWCPRHPLVVPTTHLHDTLLFVLHDTPLVVSTTPLHDTVVFTLHDMVTVFHDDTPRHAPHDTVLPRHGKMHSTTWFIPCRGNIRDHVVDCFTHVVLVPIQNSVSWSSPCRG